MNINNHNCESFFLDYYEGTLTPVEVAELLFFLEENPELKELFESYEEVHLQHEKINFPDKESLKRKVTKDELDVVLTSGITAANCEQFFVAAAEEMLTDDQTRRMYAFLSAHPEFKKEFELLQKCKLPADKIVFEHKPLLKREAISVQNREEYFVRAVENDLSTKEQKQLAAFLVQHPEYRAELEAFRNTVLTPETIFFEDKESLKKKDHKPVLITLFTRERVWYAAAAAILLLAGLFFFRSSDNNATYTADNGTVNQGAVPQQNEAKQNEKPPVQQEEQPVVQQQSTSDQQLSATGSHQVNVSVKKKGSAPAPVIEQQEKKQLAPAPIISPAPAALLAAKEKEKKQEEEKKENETIAKVEEPKQDSAQAPAPSVSQAVASVPALAPAKADEYMSLSAFANKKVRQALGVKKTECETSDKINLWDLAIAAKGGIQRVLGRSVEVRKECDAEGQKVEYVFTAGNFEISRSASKRTE